MSLAGLLAAVVGLAASILGARADAHGRPQGADTVPALEAVRVSPGEVTLDGRLDEAAWRRAAPAEGFRQREPTEGDEASEATEVRILYDDTTLYVGILARDREPDALIARLRQRDRLLQASGFDGSHRFAGDDAVAILLDPFHDRRNAFVFATNANGAEFEALIGDESPAFNADWRGVWDVRATRDAEGWSAELAIPFRTLRYPSSSDAQTWGFNAYRVIRRRNEEVLWTGWWREGGGFHRVSQAGTLEGLRDLPRRGVNLEVKPFGVGGLDQERIVDGRLGSSGVLDGGADVKWEVRPGLVLDATVNPDFAQVEADDEQINLTRFDLFFPEKRDFFLENAGVFDLGYRAVGEPPPVLLFFSRRIGINEDEEEEVPVLGGARLSGRIGRQTVGLLDMVTGPAFGEGHVNYGVARVKRDVGGSHYVGAMLTDRRSADAWNSVAGLDASFWPMPALNVRGFWARSATSGAGGDDHAYQLGADFTGDHWGFNVQHLMVGPEFDAQMGFVTREDIRRTDLFGRHTFRTGFAGLRKIDMFFGGQYVTRVDGELADWGVGPFASADWESGENLTGYWFHGFTRLDEEFDLSDRLTIPIDDYDVDQLGVFLSSSARRPWKLDAFGEIQHNYGGRVDNFGGGVSVSPGSHFTARAGWSRSRADVPAGAFSGDLVSLRLTWAFSTRLVASAFVQYNGLDDEWITNLRLSFVHRPGSDLYLVFNEERSEGRVSSRGAVAKLTYLVRF